MFLEMFLSHATARFRWISGHKQIFRHIHRGGVYFPSSSQTSCTSSAVGNNRSLLQSLQRTCSPADMYKMGRGVCGRGVCGRGVCGRGVCGRRYSSQPSRTEDGVLIYTGNLGRSVLGVKFFSYSSSVFSVCVMPLVLMKTGLGASGLVAKAAFCGFIGFFTFLTPVLLHLITKGYVVRLYHHPETDVYTAVTYSALLTEKKTTFHRDDVKVPDVSRMFTSFYAKNTSLLVNPEMFHVPHDYNHLMGYDRPFSFHPDHINKPEN